MHAHDNHNLQSLYDLYYNHCNLPWSQEIVLDIDDKKDVYLQYLEMDTFYSVLANPFEFHLFQNKFSEHHREHKNVHGQPKYTYYEYMLHFRYAQSYNDHLVNTYSLHDVYSLHAVILEMYF